MNSSLMNINELKQRKIEKIQKNGVNTSKFININEKMYIYINVVKENLRVY